LFYKGIGSNPIETFQNKLMVGKMKMKLVSLRQHVMSDFAKVVFRVSEVLSYLRARFMRVMSPVKTSLAVGLFSLVVLLIVERQLRSMEVLLRKFRTEAAIKAMEDHHPVAVERSLSSFEFCAIVMIGVSLAFIAMFFVIVVGGREPPPDASKSWDFFSSLMESTSTNPSMWLSEIESPVTWELVAILKGLTSVWPF
jgi:hypothetical protein